MLLPNALKNEVNPFNREIVETSAKFMTFKSFWRSVNIFLLRISFKRKSSSPVMGVKNGEFSLKMKVTNEIWKDLIKA